MSKCNFSILCNINTHHLTYYDLTRLILSLIIWHSRCTFFTIKLHLLNCTVLNWIVVYFICDSQFIFSWYFKIHFLFLFLLSLFVSFWSLFEFFFNLILTTLIIDILFVIRLVSLQLLCI